MSDDALLYIQGPWNPKYRDRFRYEVSGFRSLSDFDITINPGLNVVLGPNGSGKTNFIDFLDFLTAMINRNAPTAISNAGGIARVFSQENLRRKIPRIQAKITGLADLEPFLMETSVTRKYFNFEYCIDIRYSKYHSSVYIAKESLKFKNLHSAEFAYDHDRTVGSIEITRKSPIEGEEPRWKFGSYLLSNARRNPLRHLNRHRMIVRKLSDVRNIADFRKQALVETPVTAPDESILAARMVFPAIDAVRDALTRNRSFNLNPNIVREPDDISAPPFIQPDGSGLYSTIFHMQKAKTGSLGRARTHRRFEKDTIDTIVSWTQVVLPDLIDISAVADPHTGKYLVYLHVASAGGHLKIPLQSASDGTLKWLSYVCLVVSMGSDYTFEEPENYLHPKMQQFFISLLRDNIASSEQNAMFIVSTHSETIINQCNPDELILFEFHDGATSCKRVQNQESLLRQINDTGFGLGHYFSNNVIR